MDWQPIINIGATAVLGFIGWFVKGVKDDQRAHEIALTSFRLEVAKEYVTHTDLGDIKSTLRRIEDKLDSKADR
jgi:hypothetical protein